MLQGLETMCGQDLGFECFQTQRVPSRSLGRWGTVEEKPDATKVAVTSSCMRGQSALRHCFSVAAAGEDAGAETNGLGSLGYGGRNAALQQQTYICTNVKLI